MKKKKLSAIRGGGAIAGGCCLLCLLVCAFFFLRNPGKQNRETKPGQSAAAEEREDGKEPSSASSEQENGTEQSGASAGQEDIQDLSGASSEQEDVKEPSENSGQSSEEEAQSSRRQTGMEDSSKQPAAQAQSSQVLELSDILAMPAGEVLDTSAFSEDILDSLFFSEEISEEIRQRIWGNSYQENNHVSLSDLRYLRVLHVGFDGETHIGELMVNQSIAEDILEIMSELYRQKYPIEKMLLIDEYGADDESSMSDNNTSAFNYREIAGSSKLSRHALGLAIDINPRYNPYVKHTGDGGLLVSPANGGEYADRNQEFSYKITEGDLCLQLFSKHGFAWGGYWNSVKDYQHFEK